MHNRRPLVTIRKLPHRLLPLSHEPVPSAREDRGQETVKRFYAAALVSATLLTPAWSVAADKSALPVTARPDGQLAYEADDRGNRVPDFSHSGYQAGGVPVPDAPVRVVVAPAKGDSGPRIQAAIDYVSRLPADKHGVRGAVLLLAGRHEVAGGLRITTGGVVLRGQGQGPDGTVLVATGTDRRTLIRVVGKSDHQLVSKAPYAVADKY